MLCTKESGITELRLLKKQETDRQAETGKKAKKHYVPDEKTQGRK